MAVITISRQYGSGGDEIATQICKRLGYRFFDKRLMAEVGAEVGLSGSEIVDFSEDKHRVQSFLDRLFGQPRVVAQARVWQEDASGVRAATVTALDVNQSLLLVQSAVQAAYRQNNMVILGRGGQVILKDLPDVLHVRVVASPEVRIQRVQEQEQLSAEAARNLVTERDAAAADYLRRFYKVDWADALLYHLVINTDKWDIPTAVGIVVEAIRHLPERMPS